MPETGTSLPRTTSGLSQAEKSGSGQKQPSLNEWVDGQIRNGQTTKSLKELSTLRDAVKSTISRAYEPKITALQEAIQKATAELQGYESQKNGMLNKVDSQLADRENILTARQAIHKVIEDIMLGKRKMEVISAGLDMRETDVREKGRVYRGVEALEAFLSSLHGETHVEWPFQYKGLENGQVPALIAEIIQETRLTEETLRTLLEEQRKFAEGPMFELDIPS